MKDQFATTKHNIALLSHLLQAIEHIADSDPAILTVNFSGAHGHEVHLTERASDPDFLSSLQVPFVIRARNSELCPWEALAYHEGLAVFRLLDDDELHNNFHMHPSSFDPGDDDDPGEHFMDNDGRPKGYELEQHQAQAELERLGDAAILKAFSS